MHYTFGVSNLSSRTLADVLGLIFQHPGICEFPSHAFYDGKLQTAEVVKPLERSAIPFWPAMIRQGKDIPIVFCHVEGQEESTRIASAESNEESKWNQKEVLKTVCILHVITDCIYLFCQIDLIIHCFLYVSNNFIGNREVQSTKQKIIRRLSVTPLRKALGFPAPFVRNRLGVALTQALKMRSDSKRCIVFSVSDPPFVL